MDRLRIVVFLVVGAVGLLIHPFVANPHLRSAIWVWLLGMTVAAIVFGVRRHRPAPAGPWKLLAAGTSLFVVSAVGNSWGQLNPQVLELSGIGVILGYPMIGIGAARFSNAQSAGRDHGPILDSLIITMAFVAVLWEAVLTHRSVAGGLEMQGLAAMLILTASSAWVAAMTLRIVLAGTYRVTSGWLLIGSAVLGGAGATTLAWLGFSGGSPAQVTTTLWGGAVMLLGATALHPTMRRLTEPSNVDSAHVITRTVLPATALIVPPAGMAIRQLQGGSTTMVSIVMSLLIAIAVIFRFANLVVDRQRAYALSAHRSLHDPLTGLPNRSLLTSRLEAALHERHSQRDDEDVAVMFVDLDGFKAINDTHGHAAGDVLLVEVAARLERCSRAGDTVARFAGDEFVVVMPAVDLQRAVAVAERIRTAIREPIELRGVAVEVDASIGLGMGSVAGYDLERLLLTADDAMYSAKRGGRGRVHVARDVLRPDVHTGETSTPAEVVARRT